MFESKTYKAANGHTIEANILGRDFGSEGVMYSVVARLLDSDGREVAIDGTTGFGPTRVADARKARTERVRRLRKLVAFPGATTATSAAP